MGIVCKAILKVDDFLQKKKKMYFTVEIFESLKLKKLTYFSSPGVETPVNVHTMGCELN